MERIERILAAGRAAGVFRRDVDAVDLHMLISSYCVFRVANRHTWQALFGRDLLEAGRASATARCSATWSSSTSLGRPGR